MISFYLLKPRKALQRNRETKITTFLLIGRRLFESLELTCWAHIGPLFQMFTIFLTFCLFWHKLIIFAPEGSLLVYYDMGLVILATHTLHHLFKNLDL